MLTFSAIKDSDIGIIDGWDGVEPLYAFGDVSVLEKPLVTVVGEREPSRYALDFSEQIGHIAALRGCTLLTQGKPGCDLSAARACLAAGGSIVFAKQLGLMQYHPSHCADLFDEIHENGRGCELARWLYFEPSLWSYQSMYRDIYPRIVSLAFLPEAEIESTEAYCARMIAEAGSNVYACPGPNEDALSTGCNELLEAGLARTCNDFGDIERAFDSLDMSLDAAVSLDSPGLIPGEGLADVRSKAAADLLAEIRGSTSPADPIRHNYRL